MHHKCDCRSSMAGIGGIYVRYNGESCGTGGSGAAS